MRIDLNDSGRACRRRQPDRWAARLAVALVLSAAARPLSLVVHEHAAGDHSHVHSAADLAFPHEHAADHWHHHGAAHHHHHHHPAHHQLAARALAGRSLAAIGVAEAVAAPALRQPRPGAHRLHWHADHPLAFGAPRLVASLADLPLRQLCGGAAPQPFLTPRGDACRARAPPRLRSTPTATLS